ncbi:hypothetical protein E2R68_05575 [Psychromonas sp. RZ22]|uniref:hypothetical protein n=1 Tax=Psychromonas algarum TaxID=2555643 RepID=UPI00106850B4|nr:hypothetical protein [Psychromonas sp. RZ22]TEW55226.1 hypothetical protein E2R68_05575 [Psychromonas sp. RZ22]
MKYKRLNTLLVTALFTSYASAVEVKFADSAWDGITIPAGQQCQKFGGKNPITPKLAITELPAGTDSIVLEYSDRDSQKMDSGGHGVMSYALSGTVTSVEIPSVAGHSFELPPQFKMIEAHRSPGWDKAGAYMPPCSGGKGHAYYVTVKTMKGEMETSATVLEMGKF